MLNSDLVRILSGLGSVGNLKGKAVNRVKFAYAVAKNKRLVQAEVEDLKSGLKPSKEYEKFEEDRIALCVKHSEENAEGKPIFIDNHYRIKDQKAFDKAFKSLKKKYEKAIDMREESFDNYNKILKEETKLELHLIDYENIPDDITPDQIGNIFEIIREEK